MVSLVLLMSASTLSTDIVPVQLCYCCCWLFVMYASLLLLPMQSELLLAIHVYCSCQGDS